MCQRAVSVDRVSSVRIPCPACGSQGDDSILAVRDHEYALSRITTYATCGGCGTCFQAPMPHEGELTAFYPADYHSMERRVLLTTIRYDMRIRGLRELVGTRNGAVLDPRLR